MNLVRCALKAYGSSYKSEDTSVHWQWKLNLLDNFYMKLNNTEFNKNPSVTLDLFYGYTQPEGRTDWTWYALLPGFLTRLRMDFTWFLMYKRFFSSFCLFVHPVSFSENRSQRVPVPSPLPAPALITCLMTRVGIVQKLEGWATSVAKLGVVTPINNSLVSLPLSPLVYEWVG